MRTIRGKIEEDIMNMSCQDMDALGIYNMEFPSKLDPFLNDDMKDLWDSDLDQVIFRQLHIII